MSRPPGSLAQEPDGLKTTTGGGRMTIVSLQPAEPLNGLALYRVDLGLSQREAAQVTGVSRRQLQRLEAETALTPAAVRLALMYVAMRVLVNGPPLLGSDREAA
jgi:DNA-binding XRE family transcriptional regulator